MQEFLKYSNNILNYDWSIIAKLLIIILVILAVMTAIYDRYVQRTNQLLINYPLIGRFRYLFFFLREPMRQYFGDEEYYDLREKVEWVNKAAYNKPLYYSFSLSKPYNFNKIKFVHANRVLNSDEVNKNFSVTFGENFKEPFVAKSIIGRSAMSEGAISPEATQSFAKAAYMEKFPINTGEGSLTTNFLTTHACELNKEDREYLQIIQGTIFSKTIYKLFKLFFNKEVAIKVYRDLIIKKEAETFNFDEQMLAFYRIDWSKPLSTFPKKVDDIPDIIFQIGSGLYGVRDKNGNFDEDRYQKVMRFCKMTEIKIAQGAKQSGGKLLACKVTEAIAYYRGVEPHKDIISPNRFPYANSIGELFDFVGRLQKLSNKPVGIKIVISTKANFLEYAKEIANRVKQNRPYPDFLTIDGADGGTGAAPLSSMSRNGLPLKEALDIVVTTLEELQIRDKLKLIVSEKVLTPDDAVEYLCMGADFINIARGFMIAAGCIRARECSGANGKACPVGIATMDREKRSKFLIEKKARNIASYHRNFIKGVQEILAMMGKKDMKELSKSDLMII